MTTTTPEETRLPVGQFTFIGCAWCALAGGPVSEGGVRLELDVDPAGRWTLMGVTITDPNPRLVVDLAGDGDDPRLPALALVLGGWIAAREAD